MNPKPAIYESPKAVEKCLQRCHPKIINLAKISLNNDETKSLSPINLNRGCSKRLKEEKWVEMERLKCEDEWWAKKVENSR